MLNEKGGVTHVDYTRTDRAPLLIITGEIDHVVPPAIGEAIVKKYTKTGSPAIVDYKTYPGRTHRLVSQDGWEEIADYALEWATTHAASATGRREVGSDPPRSSARNHFAVETPGTRGVSAVEWCLGQGASGGIRKARGLRDPGPSPVVQAAQRRDDVVVPAPRRGQRAGEDRDVVGHALVPHRAGVDAGRAQGMPVRLAVAAQRVVLGGEDHRRRQARVDRGAQRRRIRLASASVGR